MIFNVMENKEELLFALKELREGEVSDISSNLEQYILHVSKTGETMFAWPLIQPLLTQKLRRVSDDFYAEMPTDQLPSRPNTENVQFHELQNRVLEHINRFNGTPFTIQRLCELLVNPRSHYTRPDKFLRGIEKIVMVVSTMEAMKVANGSATSAASDDEASDAEKGSSSSLNGVWCGPPSPNAKLSPNRPASPALDLTDRPDRPGPVSPSHPLSTTAKPAGHGLPETDLPVSLRPMGQLEAFVQNVSQRLTNQINASTHNGSAKEAEKEQSEAKAAAPTLVSDSAEGSRLAALLPEEGSDKSEGSRKREIASLESPDRIEEERKEKEDVVEEQGERPAKVPRLSDWESNTSSDSGEKSDEEKKEEVIEPTERENDDVASNVKEVSDEPMESSPKVSAGECTEDEVSTKQIAELDQPSKSPENEKLPESQAKTEPTESSEEGESLASTEMQETVEIAEERPSPEAMTSPRNPASQETEETAVKNAPN